MRISKVQFGSDNTYNGVTNVFVKTSWYDLPTASIPTQRNYTWSYPSALSNKHKNMDEKQLNASIETWLQSNGFCQAKSIHINASNAINKFSSWLKSYLQQHLYTHRIVFRYIRVVKKHDFISRIIRRKIIQFPELFEIHNHIQVCESVTSFRNLKRIASHLLMLYYLTVANDSYDLHSIQYTNCISPASNGATNNFIYK